MVDFKKMRDDWWNRLSKEEQEKILHRNALEKEHTYYETTTQLEDNYNGKQQERTQVVKLYCPIINGEVGERILLSFGGYQEYGFDKRFCLKLLRDFKRDCNRRFCVDVGNELYVKNVEMIRIVKEAIESLVKKEIELTEDYYPNLSKTDMGKMLNEMGLR